MTNFSDARRNCRLNGGHLAAFETEAEFDAYDNLPSNYWLGADDIEKEGKNKLPKSHLHCKK